MSRRQPGATRHEDAPAFVSNRSQTSSTCGCRGGPFRAGNPMYLHISRDELPVASEERAVEGILGALPTAEGPIRAWVAIAAKAHWANPAEIKRQFGSTVDFVGDSRVIFDLGGNKYRLVVHASFSFGR